MKTLEKCLPVEFVGCEYQNTPAYKLRGVQVVKEHDARSNPWPGTHKNVTCWFELANGKAVGFNENPGRGWSFPVIALD